VVALVMPLDDPALLVALGAVGASRSPGPGRWLLTGVCLTIAGMNRRRFLQASLAGALAGPLATEAQQAARVWRMGSSR
jgi:hypothetical protein